MKKTNILITFLSLALVISLVYTSFHSHFNDKISCPDKFDFVAPDIECEADQTTKTLDIKRIVNLSINNMLYLKKATKVSVFYRDLDNRQWFGINENENFNPASLLKLPIAISYYKYAEIDPGILSQKYKYKNSAETRSEYTQFTKPAEAMENGKEYTVDEYISRMIKYSDNSALPVLVNNIDNAFINKVFVDLGVYIPVSNGTEQDFVSVKIYSSIFRALYNSSYLNKLYSNKLLETMSTSSFRSGIASGIPKNIKFANKFGERIILDPVTKEVNNLELHDCGIVYKPENHYILCVMTQGTNYEDLLSVLGDISKKVYENTN